MKSAKEMFEELGFEYTHYSHIQAHKFIRPNDYLAFGTEKFFYYESPRRISIVCFKCNEDCIKAHIKMMKELGWL